MALPVLLTDGAARDLEELIDYIAALWAALAWLL